MPPSPSVALIALAVGGALLVGCGGSIGRYRLEPSGDPSVGPITILRAESSFTPFREIRPEPQVVTAARTHARPVTD